MSTPSTLLLCAGAAASLAGVWTLAGLSESSPMRSTPRVLVAAAIGLLGEAIVYGRSPAELRAELALPLLFALAGVLALAVGAAKIEAALADKDGQRVVRRAGGIVAGTFFGMAAVGAASFDLSSASLAQARLGWALMFALVASTIVVFAERTRYAGVGLLGLGKRAFVLVVVGVGLLVGARFTAAQPRAAGREVPAVSSPSAQTPAVIESATVAAASVSAAADSAVAAASAAPTESAAAAGAAPSASAAPPVATGGEPGTVQVDAVTPRGMLEADVRGGVARRMDKLQACLVDPKNSQRGTLSLKIGVDPSGSVTYSKAVGGDLSGTPAGTCLLAVFYKMGFAATTANNASFEISLRAP
jgi:FtsH-binding integral membrane protein